MNEKECREFLEKLRDKLENQILILNAKNRINSGYTSEIVFLNDLLKEVKGKL